MRTLVLASVICLALMGCVSTPQDVGAVWTQATPPPADLAAPRGFKITPAQAFAVARESDMISLKHVWHLYADSRYYYVHDAFLGSSERLAHAQGVRIDGLTGEIVRR